MRSFGDAGYPTPAHELAFSACLTSHRAEDPDAARMAALLLAGLRALWERARPSLGERTLEVIFARVFRVAQRRHPELAGVGLCVVDGNAIAMDEPAVGHAEAVAFVIAEALAALARHTADTLTAGLHASLAAAMDGPPERARIASREGASGGVAL